MRSQAEIASQVKQKLNLTFSVVRMNQLDFLKNSQTFYQTVQVGKTLSTLECRPFAVGQTGIPPFLSLFVVCAFAKGAQFAHTI